MQAHHPAHSSDQIPGRRAGHAVPVGIASRSASFDRRTRSDDSWVEISSQPSSSSLSSVNDDIVTTGLRVQHHPRARRRRALRPGAPSQLSVTHRSSSVGGTSSQEEYEESESESDRVMTSSGEGGLILPGHNIFHAASLSSAVRSTASEDSVPLTVDDEDENRTAISYPINNDACFTPQPNAFSHPPSSGQARHVSAPIPGSYFPATRPPTRSAARQSLSAQPDQQSHMPQNILSPSYNAAAQHDEALRASLSTLLSCAAAARGLPKATANKRGQAPTTTTAAPARSNRIEPLSFRLVPESAVPIIHSPPQSHEPTFHPTLRRSRRRPSTSTSASAASDRFSNHNNNNNNRDTKRKAPPAPPAIRSSSRERRALKKARRASSSEELYSQQQGGVITPTLLTWVVSAGVVVVLSALSFGAGYSLGREAGRFEAGGGGIGGGVGGGGVGGGGRVGLVPEADEQLRGCAREAARSGLGLKRGLLGRSAVQV
ncbi:hypothetical protein B0A55_08782 [Friedmanniomyces simplex]|uniref:REJ domain-containing protein n=1 Tax=Friedmanniomyces simplex TaxID=329884 RepID=A0A4V5NFQ1_9PEZI|nr:hypothetical protein B0A55_08782 [Friedmanniomyces simplex]